MLCNDQCALDSNNKKSYYNYSICDYYVNLPD